MHSTTGARGAKQAQGEDRGGRGWVEGRHSSWMWTRGTGSNRHGSLRAGMLARMSGGDRMRQGGCPAGQPWRDAEWPACMPPSGHRPHRRSRICCCALIIPSKLSVCGPTLVAHNAASKRAIAPLGGRGGRKSAPRLASPCHHPQGSLLRNVSEGVFREQLVDQSHIHAAWCTLPQRSSHPRLSTLLRRRTSNQHEVRYCACGTA